MKTNNKVTKKRKLDNANNGNGRGNELIASIEILECSKEASLCYEGPDDCGGSCCDNDCQTDSGK